MTTYTIAYDEKGNPQTLFAVNADGSTFSFPYDPKHPLFAGYEAWVAEGNTPNPYVPPLPEVPPQVPLWAFRTVLHNNDLFDQTQAIVAGSTDIALKNVWEYGNFALRNSTAINTIAYTLGLTTAQVDQMFIDANNLNV